MLRKSTDKMQDNDSTGDKYETTLSETVRAPSSCTVALSQACGWSWDR